MSPAAVTSNAPPGWFGKLPSLGDFASRRLPDHFVRDWDDWLQLGLTWMRGELGEAWLSLYLVAPIRRFWLSPDVLGESAWAGLLMPSVDRVGRHFPLTLALPLGTASPGLADVLAADDWLAQLDAVARQVLDVDFSVEDFEARLAAMPPWPGSTSTGQHHERLAGALLAPYRDGEMLPCSVWWCEHADTAADFSAYDRLPPATAFPDLMQSSSAHLP